MRNSVLAAGLLLASAIMAQAAPAYRITKTVPLGTPDRWDYVVSDAAEGRVYIAHGDIVSVVDEKEGAVVGTIAVGGATHGIATVPALGKGYTDDGKAGMVIVFDLKSLKILRRIKAEPDADGIVYDQGSGHILTIDGDSGKVTVIDPKTDTVVATIDGGGGLEFGVTDGKGKFYVDGVDKNEIIRIDLITNKVEAHWPMPGCVKPHGLAIDRVTMRLFASCASNVMVVVNAVNGATVATLPIGEGTDFAQFDASRRIAFSSNRDGTLSLIAEQGPDKFVALPPVKTQYGARTMGLNEKTGRVYLASADYTIDEKVPASDPRHRYTMKPGSAVLLFLDPVN